MKTFNAACRVAIASALVFLSACSATFKVPEGISTVPLTIDLNADSTGVVFGRHYTVAAMASADNCGVSRYGDSIANLYRANASEILGPFPVAIGEPFTLAILYTQTRPAEYRSCSFTASFMPEAKGSYVAQFRSVDNARECQINVLENKAGELVPVQMNVPENTCITDHQVPEKRNGVGSGIKYEVVRAVPAAN
jgi:hypothetical protein